MKILVAICLTLMTQSGFAQTKNRAEYSAWQQCNEQTAMVYANKANVRHDANISSAIKDSLQTGDTVFVKSISTKFYAQNGIYAAWAAIAYNKDNINKTGFIWLGSLALAFEVKGTEAYIFGLESVKQATAPGEYSSGKQFNLGVKATLGKNLIASTTFTVEDNESFSYLELKLLGNPNLKNLTEVVRLMCSGEACGIATNYYYFGLASNKFLNLPTKSTIADAGAFYHSESLIFPNEKAGKPNKIIRYTVDEEILEEGTDFKKEKTKKSTKTEVYNWDGLKAVLVKK